MMYKSQFQNTDPYDWFCKVKVNYQKRMALEWKDVTFNSISFFIYSNETNDCVI